MIISAMTETNNTHLNVISVGFNLPEKVMITKTYLSTTPPHQETSPYLGFNTA